MPIVSERPTPADSTWEDREQERRDRMTILRRKLSSEMELLGTAVDRSMWMLAVSHGIAVLAMVDEAAQIRIEGNEDEQPDEPDRMGEP